MHNKLLKILNLAIRPKALILISISFLSLNAQAVVIIEPYIGYGQTQVKGADRDDYHGKQSGMVFGERAGARIGKYFILADLFACTGTFSPQDKSQKRDATTSSVYLVGGINNSRYPLRFWLGMSPLSALVIEYDGDDGDGVIFKGQGIKLGVGYDPFDFASFNLEIFYHRYKTSREKINKNDYGERSLNRNITSTGIAISTSIPIQFGN